MKKQLFCYVILAICGSAYAQVPSYVPSNGLVGWWPFNGNANDESGNGNNGTIYGASLSTDRNNNSNAAYNFNGSSNYIEVASSSSISVSSAYTLSVWFRASSWSFNAPIDEHAIISKMVDGAWYGGYEIYHGGSTGSIRHIGNITNNFSIGSDSGQVNQWYHIVCTFNGSKVKYYINNRKADSISLSSSIQTSNIPLRFGRRGGAGTYNCWFNGKIDDIGIWNRALSPQEINNLYNATTPLPIKLYDCHLNYNDNKTELEWSTLDETASSELKLYKSNDGYNWKLFHTMPKNETGKSANHYTYHLGQLNSKSYFKIALSDQNESHSCPILRYDPNVSDNFIVYPNPAQNTVNIHCDLDNYEVRIYSTLGKLIYNNCFSKQNNQIDISQWPKGVYYVELIDAATQTNKVQKLIRN